ncbi:hypothetical protein RclHR1_08950004 [Rhizophagus clarus]|nr:hypothetical protein RclHR1_08950004 [Rhizophagus clarus]
MKNQRANITFGQIYNESPKQRSIMHNKLKRGYVNKGNWLYSEVNEITKDISVTWSMLKINGKEIRVVIDLEAAASVISNSLRKKLLNNIKSSKSSFTVANGTKVASIGKIEIILEINSNIKIPVIVEVMDKDREELILGNNILKDNKHDSQNEYSKENYSDQESEYESEYGEGQKQELFGISEEVK